MKSILHCSCYRGLLVSIGMDWSVVPIWNRTSQCQLHLLWVQRRMWAERWRQIRCHWEVLFVCTFNFFAYSIKNYSDHWSYQIKFMILVEISVLDSLELKKVFLLNVCLCMQRWKENYLIYFNETHQLSKYRWIFFKLYELMLFLAKISHVLIW